MIKLAVIHPFADYQRGDEITDEVAVSAILSAEQSAYVVKVAVPEPVPTSKK